MRNLLFFLLITFLYPTFSSAQESNTTASLGGYIWYDKNLDGIQDYGEHEVRNVRVYLLKDGVNTNEFKATDVNGNYLFENLEPNHKYSIRVLLPKNYKSFTKPNATDDNKDSDIIKSVEEDVVINEVTKTLIVGYSDEVYLQDGDNYRDLDAGMLCRCIAWIDVEKSTNGVDADISDEAVEVKEGDEVVWEYKVVNSSMVEIDNIELTDDKEGVIDCPKDTLKPNEEMICIKKGIAQKGLYRNLATVTGYDPNGNEVEDKDPSHYIAAANLYVEITKKACLGDFYWFDENLNGIQDKNEYGVVGIKVELYNEDKKLLSTTKTDKDGRYLFCDLEPANYYVKFDLPDTYLFIPKDRGSDLKDSDASSNGWSHLVELESGENDLSIDAGIYCSCKESEVTGIRKDLGEVSPVIPIFILVIMFLIAFTVKPEKSKR